jgi:hypothetical protein
MGSLHFCQVQAGIVLSPGNTVNSQMIDKHPCRFDDRWQVARTQILVVC